jgi:hypothetical protein
MARKLYMCQDSYIKNIANRFHLTDSQTLTTPASTIEYAINMG